MALINCPECGKEVSDHSSVCIHCGYPINPIAVINEKTVQTKKTKKKTFIICAILMLFFVSAGFIFMNRETKPKLDESGNPMFIEFTDEVYTNPKKHFGYHVEFKGKVFQTLGDNGVEKGAQIWLDPDTCEKNLIVYYTNDVEIKDGDYIVGIGYINSIESYNNSYGAQVKAPTVVSNDLSKSDYINVMSPTISSVSVDNLKQEKYGYSVQIKNVEFSKRETRIYVNVVNNGKSSIYVDADSAVVLQADKQYNVTSNFDADYERLPYEIIPGATCSGIILFPPLSDNGFELSLEATSSNSNEKLGVVTMLIGKEESKITKTWPVDKVVTYASLVGTFTGKEGTLTFNKNGTIKFTQKWYDEYDDQYYTTKFTGTWKQTKNYASCTWVDEDGMVWNWGGISSITNKGMYFDGSYYKRK